MLHAPSGYCGDGAAARFHRNRDHHRSRRGCRFSRRHPHNQMKRTLPELAQWFWSDNHFPAGCYLLTGTGFVPPDGFTLASKDEIRITITGLGPLINTIT